jgi:hypothetical protein
MGKSHLGRQTLAPTKEDVMSSTTNQFFDVANLKMLDRILRKAGFRGGEIYAIDDKEINATSFLIQCFQTGIIDEIALKSALKMYLSSQLNSGLRPLAIDDGSLSRWQDDGGAPARDYKLTHYTTAKQTSAPLRLGGYRFPKARLPERA